MGYYLAFRILYWPVQLVFRLMIWAIGLLIAFLFFAMFGGHIRRIVTAAVAAVVALVLAFTSLGSSGPYAGLGAVPSLDAPPAQEEYTPPYPRPQMPLPERIDALPTRNDTDDRVPRFVYRSGSASAANFTPRPAADPEGLSTFDSPAAFVADQRPRGRIESGNKVKMWVIDVSRLKLLMARADPPPPGHVTLTPGSQELVRAWAATRDSGGNAYTLDVMSAVVGRVTVVVP